MITENSIYWITRLDYFCNFCWAMGILLVIFATFGVIVGFINWFEEEDKRGLKLFLPALFLSLLIVFGSLFIPTTKEMCAIKIIPKITNSEKVQELPNKVVDLAEEWIEELKPKKEKIK